MAKRKKQTPPAPNQTTETTATEWKSRFEHCKDRQQQVFTDAKKYYDIMYAVFNTSNIAPWRSKVYVPVLASKAWDLIARLSDVVPLFDVTVKNELEFDEKTGQYVQAQNANLRERLIQAKLHYDYMNCGGQPMKLRVFDPLLDSIVAGTGYAYVPWCTESQAQHARKFDPETGGITDNENVITKQFEKGYNGFTGLNFFNVFVAEAPSFWEAPYIVVRGFKPLVDMKADKKYSNLDKINTTMRQDDFQTFNEARNRVVNQNDSTKDETVDMVTYYECYERTAKGIKLTTYAEGENPEDGWVTIRPASYPYWHNMFPVVPFYTRRKSFSTFGESLFENNRTLQSATNDLFNHYLDNWNVSVDSMLIYEDGTLTNDFVIEPGGEITYTGELPKQFKFPEPNPQQLTQVMNVLNAGIEAATVPQYLSGTPNSNIDKTQGTATGVTKITEAATEKVGFYRDNFKQSMKVVGQIWLSNLQQFMDSPEEIRVMQNGTKQPAIVTPGDFQGEVELDVDDDSMTPVSRSDRRDMISTFSTQVVGLQNQAIQQAEIFQTYEDIPRFNFVDMIADLAYVYSVKDPKNYLQDNQEAVQKLEAAKQQAAQNPPTKPPIENINYKDATPYIRAQMEQQAGLQPDPIHEHAQVTDAMQHAVTQHQLTNPQAAVAAQAAQGGIKNGQSSVSTGNTGG